MEKLVETIREKDDYNGLVSICSEKIEGNISQLTAGPQYRSDKSRKPRKTGFPLKMLRERPGY